MKIMRVCEVIENKIYIARCHKIMLSSHLAQLYGVPVKALIQAVKRNIDRFPSDFMFQLTDEEWKNLKSQFVTSSWGGLRRANPYAFTEQGVAMLSSVLRSKRAVRVNITIMRTFVKLREALLSYKELAQRLNELENKTDKHDTDIQAIFEVIRQLMAPPPEEPKRRIGFRI